ncbi:hypothetical protein DQ04_15661000 [Trypanosoma grayi]|uniref:hypothetical protein n=1 Tax=Trypanosoma grayi TaxID=71804 RepID=UPI0004F416D8|nr:hypothetical protein DQ04_15661000 [Trypanosoma grayi]KEG06146.1 hypothetical protein DQ04_15661000 [Trypanosoma grayi]
MSRYLRTFSRASSRAPVTSSCTLVKGVMSSFMASSCLRSPVDQSDAKSRMCSAVLLKNFTGPSSVSSTSWGATSSRSLAPNITRKAIAPLQSKAYMIHIQIQQRALSALYLDFCLQQQLRQQSVHKKTSGKLTRVIRRITALAAGSSIARHCPLARSMLFKHVKTSFSWLGPSHTV